MNVLTTSLLGEQQQGGYLQQIAIKENASNYVGGFPITSFVKDAKQEGLYQIKHLSIPLGLIITKQNLHKNYPQNEETEILEIDYLFSKFSSPKSQKKKLKIVKHKKTKKLKN
jgi:hypothetical protein